MVLRPVTRHARTQNDGLPARETGGALFRRGRLAVIPSRLAEPPPVVDEDRPARVPFPFPLDGPGVASRHADPKACPFLRINHVGEPCTQSSKPEASSIASSSATRSRSIGWTSSPARSSSWGRVLLVADGDLAPHRAPGGGWCHGRAKVLRQGPRREAGRLQVQAQGAAPRQEGPRAGSDGAQDRGHRLGGRSACRTEAQAAEREAARKVPPRRPPSRPPRTRRSPPSWPPPRLRHPRRPQQPRGPARRRGAASRRRKPPRQGPPQPDKKPTAPDAGAAPRHAGW